MPRDDAAQIELWRLPLLSHANRSLALDRFSDLTRRNDVAVKGSLKRPQCDGIAIGCACPELQFFLDMRQFLLGNIGVAIRDGLRARPALGVATLPGFRRPHEGFSVWTMVSHSVFLSVLAPIDHRSSISFH